MHTMETIKNQNEFPRRVNDDKLENLCEEFAIKPYKKYGDNLPLVLWDLMNNADKWTELPYKKPARFIDFARGIRETTETDVQAFNKTSHLNVNYSGFVRISPSSAELPIRHDIDFFPWTAYIHKGEVRYAQSELLEDGIIINKTSLFAKGNFTLELYASKSDAYECETVFMNRELNKQTAEGYQVKIFQFPEIITIEVHDDNYLMGPRKKDETKSPIIQIDFKKEYPEVLRALSSRNDFPDLQSLSDLFGKTKTSGNSMLYNILIDKGINYTKRDLQFSDAVNVMNYLKSKNKTDIQ